MRNYAQHPLDEHQLSAMMHLVLLCSHEMFETRPRSIRTEIGDPLVEILRRQRLHPGGEPVAFGVQQRDDLGFVARLPLLGLDARDGSRKVNLRAL